jgi:MFS transporter, putative metabolite transport protein
MENKKSSEDSTDKVNSKRVWRNVTNLNLASIVYGYTETEFNICAYSISATLEWGDMSTFYIALFSAMIPLSQLLGSLIASKFITKWGRRSTLLAFNAMYMLGSGIQLIPNTFCFGIGRFLTGLPTGIYYTLIPLYTNEITPELMVSRTGPVLGFADNLGVVLTLGLGLMLPNSNSSPFNYLWMVIFTFPSLIIAFQTLFLLCVLREDTAQFYLEKKKEEKAKAAILQAYFDEDFGMERVRNDLKSNTQQGNEVGFTNVLCQKKYRKMTRFSILHGLFYELNGITLALYYSTLIFSNISSSFFVSQILNLAFGFVIVIAAGVYMRISDNIRRKNMFLGGYITAALTLFGIGILLQFDAVSIIFPLILIFLFVIESGMSINSVVWMYLGEIVNPPCFSLATSMSFITGTVLTFAFPYVMEIFGLSMCFYALGLFNFIAFLYILFEFVETKDRPKGEILNDMSIITSAYGNQSYVETSSVIQNQESLLTGSSHRPDAK